MKKQLNWLFIIFLLTSASCNSTKKATGTNDDGKIEVTFMLINDVYEIAPLSAGKEGGIARVATLKKQLLAENKNTFMVMAGDFVSPSVYNSLKYEGKRIRGKQMVDALNAAGLDFAMFGNHEFDISESELQDRINESGFKWISTNTFHKVNGQAVPFGRTTVTSSFPETYIMNVSDNDGTQARIGFFAITLPFNKADYVTYTDAMTAAKMAYNLLKDSVDAVIAITHQAMADDVELAKEIPGLAAILGGHEHDMRFAKVGNVYITKAHANAKSAYVVKMAINKTKSKINVSPRLQYLNETIALDSLTNVVVQKWVDIADQNYASLGFDARKVVMNSGEPLDGRETEIRSTQTNLTRLVVKGVAFAAPQADVALMNSGSIRVDDMLTMPVTQYDIIRTLPFGGGIREVEMKGSLLIKTLTVGRSNIGIGGYLQVNENVTLDNKIWKINNTAIDANKTYRVAMPDFLLSGMEANLDFLKPVNPEMLKVYDAETKTGTPLSDIRIAVIKYLENLQSRN